MKNINFKKLILILGIVIVLNLFLNYGIHTFYKNPKIENFCEQELLSKQYQIKGECESVGGFWTENKALPLQERSAPAYEPKQGEPTGWCDAQYSCRKDFDKARDYYNRNVFIILIIAGFISVVVGFMVGQSEAVSLGLSFGGILSFIVGTIRYWSAMDDYLRFIILSVALAVLIWIGIKKFRNEPV